MDESFGVLAGKVTADVVYFGIFLLCFAGWLQHLYTCFTEQLYGFLIAGAIFFPVAIIHGWGIWLGFWH